MAGEYDAYLSAILAAVKPITERALKAEKSAVHAWMSRVLTGKPPTTPIPAQKLSKHEEFVSNLLRGFGEISSTHDALQSIPKLARHAPSRRSGIGAAEYLRMMVELYLSEIYILKKRCDTYRTRIIRAYRKGQTRCEHQEEP